MDANVKKDREIIIDFKIVFFITFDFFLNLSVKFWQ
jgi:hypothetical protein